MLSVQRKSQLDAIVKSMIDNGEDDRSIQFVVDDFKAKYEEPVKEALTSPEFAEKREQVYKSKPWLRPEPVKTTVDFLKEDFANPTKALKTVKDIISTEEFATTIKQPVQGLKYFTLSLPSIAGRLVQEIGETAEDDPNMLEWILLTPALMKKNVAREAKKTDLDEKIAQWGIDLAEKNEEWVAGLELDKDAKEGINKLYFDLGSGAGSLALAIGATALTKRPEVAAITFGTMAKAGKYDELRKAGVDTQTASLLSTGAGITEGLLEGIGLDFMLRSYATPLKAMLVRSASEGIQEFSQEVGSNLWSKIGYDKGRNLLDNAWYSGLIGTILGFGSSSVIETLNLELDKDMSNIPPVEREKIKKAIANFVEKSREEQEEFLKDKLPEIQKTIEKEKTISPKEITKIVPEVKPVPKEEVKPKVIEAIPEAKVKPTEVKPSAKPRVIEAPLPAELKIKKYKSPTSGEIKMDLLSKATPEQKTWSTWVGDQSESFMKEYVKKTFGKDIDIVPTENYIWGKQKTGKFGWIKEVKPEITKPKVIEPEPSKFIKHRETTLLKEKIRNIARGVREGTINTKQEIKSVQTEIIGLLDKSDLELRDKAKFIRAIKNTQTKQQLKRNLPKIEERIVKLVEAEEGREIIGKIKKAIEPTIVKGKKPKGKYTPEIQKELDFIRPLVLLSQKQANERIENNLAKYQEKMPIEIAKENKILSLFTGDPKSKRQLLDIINKLKEKGDIDASLKKFNIQSDIEAKQNLVIDRVTGQKGIEEGRLKGETAKKDTITRVKQYLKAIGTRTILTWQGLMITLDFNSSVKKKSLADYFTLIKNENKYKELQADYKNKFNEAISSIYGVKNTPNNILKVVQKLSQEEVLVDKYKMTRDELIKRFMEIQDPTLIDSFLRGNGWSEKTFEAIEETITPQDKKFANWQLGFYRELYNLVNPVYERMNGVSLPFNEFYSPIRRKGFEVKPGHTEFLEEAFYRRAVTNKSLFTRVKNINPIERQSSLKALDTYATEMNYYIAWAEKVRELDSVFTNPNVREAIKQEFPSSILSAIENKIQDISTQGNKTARRVGWVDYLRNNFVIGNLALKPSIAIKQLVSTIAYGEKIGFIDLGKGILDFAKNPLKNYKTLQDESVFIKQRGAGMERDIRSAIKEGVFDRYSKKQNFANTLITNVRLGDKGAIILGSWAMRLQGLKQGRKLADIIDEYEDFSAETQQSSDISRLSEIQLGGSLTKLFTIFKSSQRAYFQKEVNAVKSMFRKDGFTKDNLKKVGKTMLIYHVLLPVVFQWVANLGGWDEEDRKEYLRAALLGSFDGVFIAGDIIDGIIRQALGLRVWGTESVISDVGDDIRKIMSNLSLDDISLEDFKDAIEGFASAATGILGLPIEYAYDILESLYEENYKTALLEILGWSEYVIGEKSRFAPEGKKGKVLFEKPSLNLKEKPKIELGKPKLTF